MSKKFLGLIALALLILATVFFFRSGGAGSAALWQITRGGTWLPPLVGISALVDSVNPCAFSILLLTIAFLVSLGKTRSKILTIGGFYIAGIFLAYIGIGLGILSALHIFNTPHFMAKVGASLLILFGAINVINDIFPAFPIKLKIPNAAHGAMARLMERASLPTAFLLGALVGLCEFPCTGGPYLLVLGLLHDQATRTTGFGYLVIYNLIFILPLVVILALASDKGLLAKVEAWKKDENHNMRLWGGIAAIALGVLMFFF
jgi:cytochrome c-type biogenesis protein